MERGQRVEEEQGFAVESHGAHAQITILTIRDDRACKVLRLTVHVMLGRHLTQGSVYLLSMLSMHSMQ